MAFQPLIPQSTDLKYKSQADILGNFTALGTWSAVDHVSLTTAVNTGMHAKATFPVGGALTSPAGTVMLYAQNNSVPAPALFCSVNGAAGKDFTTFLNGSPGWCKLPCGIMFQWGTVSIAGDSSAQTFVTPFPTAVYNVTLTSHYATGIQAFMNVISLQSPTGFTASCYDRFGHPQTYSAYYFAIGI